MQKVKNNWVIFIFLLILVTLLRLPSLDQPLENDSASVAYHARLIARGEPLYGTHHPAHHMPGTYYTFAFAFKLLGTSVRSIKILLIFWITLTVFSVYLLGKLIGGIRVGLIASVTSAVLFSHLGLGGTTAKPEMFVGLFRVLSVLILFYFFQKKILPIHFFWIGILNGLTFIYKVNYLSPLLLVGVVLLSEMWINRLNPHLWRPTLLRGIWVMLGFLTPFFLIALYFLHIGLLTRFLEIFQIGFDYIQLRNAEFANPLFIIIYPLLILSANNAVVVVVVITNSLSNLVAIRKLPTSWEDGTAMKYYVILWFGLCFLEAAVSRTYLVYYYLVFVPALALLFSISLDEIQVILHKTSWAKYSQAPISFFLLAAIFFSCFVNYKYYRHYSLYIFGKENYQQFLNNGLPEGVGKTIQQVQEIADYITLRTAPQDTIYYWSSLMDLYFMLDRRASYEIIWPYYAGVLGHRDKIFEAEYFLVGDNSLGIQETPQWLLDGLNKNYNLEIVLYEQKIYHHK